MIARLAVLAGCVSLAMGRMKFINPPEAGRKGDFSQNPSYPYGSVVALAWTEAADNAATSLTLWQVNQTDGGFLGNMEYITRNSISTTAFSWIVATSKDLTVSDTFFISIFEEGQRVSDCDSQYFNITRRSDSGVETELPAQSSSAVPTTSPTEAAATSSIPASNDNEQSPSRESQEPSPSAQSSDSLNKSAIIGLAVALPCGIILSALGAWLFYGRRRRLTQQHKHLRDMRGRRDSYDDGRGGSTVGLGLGYGPHEMYASKGHAPAEQVRDGGKGFPAVFELAAQR